MRTNKMLTRREVTSRMREILGIYNTNQTNKYGYRFTTEALESGLSQAWNEGTPMFISHDYHRPLGWSKPLGLQIMPTQVALLGLSSFPENDSEQEAINLASQAYLADKLGNVEPKEKEELEYRLGEYFSGEEVFLVRECTSVVDENIARKALPDLFVGDETDKRCLVSLKDLNQIAPGVFEYEGVAVFAHRYFRRSLSQINNLNDTFLSKLYELKNHENLDLKIALDPHSIGLIKSYRSPIELEYWWGPKFNDSLMDIPSGVTRHESPERERFFHGISRTEFWWHKQDGIQSLECEEIRDIPTFGVSHEDYGCRYVHSMIDKKTEKPFHLDGAIRVYDEDSFIERLDVDISKAGKDTTYIKLWRIDGELDISTWKDLICHFYRDNHLPGEYLGGADALSRKAKVNEDFSEDIVKNYLAPYVSEEDGIEIFLSYHPKETYTFSEEINVVTYESVVSGEDRYKVIELSSLDFIKMLRCHFDRPIHIEEDVRFFAYEDLDINLPSIVLKGHDSVENGNNVLSVFKLFVKKVSDTNCDRMITFNVMIEYDECVAQFSFLSNAQSLKSYFEGHDLTFPDKFCTIGKWSSLQNDLLRGCFKESRLLPGGKSRLETSGTHRIKRSFVEPDMITIDGLNFGLRIHESCSDLIQAVAEEKITIAPASLINKTECISCEKEYLLCNCCALGEDQGGVKIIDFQPLGFTWARERA